MRVARAAWSIVFIALLSGCAAKPVAPPASQAATVAPAAKMESLLPSEKRSMIASNFPAEVPVPRGEIVRAQAQGVDAWDYTIAVPASPDGVVGWYRDAYVGRGWYVAREGQFDAVDGAGAFADYRKGTAESSVRVYGAGSDGVAAGGDTRVEVTVGVGAQVLETQ